MATSSPCTFSMKGSTKGVKWVEVLILMDRFMSKEMSRRTVSGEDRRRIK